MIIKRDGEVILNDPSAVPMRLGTVPGHTCLLSFTPAGTFHIHLIAAEIDGLVQERDWQKARQADQAVQRAVIDKSITENFASAAAHNPHC